MSQRAAIKRDLELGKRISPLSALNDYGCLRLCARIYELKRAGVPIVKTMVSDHFSGKHYAMYWLAKGRAA